MDPKQNDAHLVHPEQAWQVPPEVLWAWSPASFQRALEKADIVLANLARLFAEGGQWIFGICMSAERSEQPSAGRKIVELHGYEVPQTLPQVSTIRQCLLETRRHIPPGLVIEGQHDGVFRIEV